MAGLARYGSYRKFFLQPKKRFTVNLIRFKVGSRESAVGSRALNIKTNELLVKLPSSVITPRIEGRGVGGRGVF